MARGSEGMQIRKRTGEVMEENRENEKEIKKLQDVKNGKYSA